MSDILALDEAWAILQFNAGYRDAFMVCDLSRRDAEPLRRILHAILPSDCSSVVLEGGVGETRMLFARTRRALAVGMAANRAPSGTRRIEAFGGIFGYPPCCVEAYAQLVRELGSESGIPDGFSYSSKEDAPGMAVPHKPCRRSCSASLRAAAQLAELARPEDVARLFPGAFFSGLRDALAGVVFGGDVCKNLDGSANR